MPIFGILADHLFESDWLAGGRMEQRLAFVSRGPLRAGDVIFAARLGSVCAAAGFHESFDKGLLFINGDGRHLLRPAYPTGEAT